MKWSSQVIPLIVLAAMTLSACGVEGSNGNTPATVPAMPGVGTLAPSPESTLNVPQGTDSGSVDTPPSIIPVTGDTNPARLSNMLQFDVFNQTGQQVGEVSDMVMDLDSSTILYVVVSTGGFLNVGEKHLALPWSALQVQASADPQTAGPQNYFKLVVGEDVFFNAPVINTEKDLPGVGQPTGDWDQEIRSYWNVETDSSNSSVTNPSAVPGPTQSPTSESAQLPTPEGMPLSGVLLASDALGFDFKLQGEEDLNVSIDDMIINVQTGKILYIVIHTNFENAGEQRIPIPYSMVSWDPTAQAYILNVDMVTLQSAPFYIDDIFPDTTHPGWDDTYVHFWRQHGLGERP